MYEATWVFWAERLLASRGGYSVAFRDAFALFVLRASAAAATLVRGRTRSLR